ncbi:GTP-binding protein YchF [Umbelopsis sp. PMI_123]|nr:GTP-binding protein YchF [Umbelopsis sp. PMI_123]
MAMNTRLWCATWKNAKSVIDCNAFSRTLARSFQTSSVCAAKKKKQKAAESEEKLLLGRPSNNLRIGVVGMPNIGKSSLFNALTSSSVAAENYPFCTIDPEEARVTVPDDRFDWLCEQYSPEKITPAFLTVIDIAGLVRGAASGAGLGNAFLSHVRSVDAVYHLVRAFDNDDVQHVEDVVDPARDLEIIHEELRLKDEETLEKVITDLSKSSGKGGSSPSDLVKKNLETAENAALLLAEGSDIRKIDWTNSEIEFINTLHLLTAKPMIYLANVSEDDYLNQKVSKRLAQVKQWVQENNPTDPIIPVSVALESKLSQMTIEERTAFCKEAGLQSQLEHVILEGYKCLNLIHYFTAGPSEVRAWTVRNNTKAPQAAGVIHTDFERGFIMAEVMKFEDLKKLGSESAVKAAGKYLQKGKDYKVEDGDIIYFKFNVTAKKK